MKLLKDVIECPKKALYKERLNENLLKNKRVNFKVSLRNALKEIDFFDLAERENIEKYFQTYLDSCVMKKEREETLKVLEFKLKRMITFFKENNYKIIHQNYKCDVVYDKEEDIHNRNIFDIVYTDESGVKKYFANIYEGKRNYTAREKTKGHMINNPVVYTKWLAVTASYPGNEENFYIVEIGLQRKNENANFSLLLAEDFKEKTNLFSCQFIDDESYIAHEAKLEEVPLITWNKNAIDGTDDKSKCDLCSYKSLCKYKNKKEYYKKSEDEKENNKAPSIVKFTINQQKFIDDHDGYIRVIASAGSGKTTCIINRVVSILKNDNCDIDDMLMITFTDKGCSEMKEKLAFWLKREGLDAEKDDFNVFTFNSFGYKIIKENYEKLGFEKEPMIIDFLQGIDFTKRVVDSIDETISSINYRNPLMNIFNAQGAVIKLHNFFNIMKKNNVASLENAKKLEIMPESDIEYVFKAYQKYNAMMKEENVIDYDDQLFLALELLNNYPEIAQKYSYQHILVDEAQDTSGEQFDLLNVLIQENGVRSFVVCGDDAQAIYGFRGVDMEYLLNFDKKYANVKDYYLMDNFRSTAEIIEVADNVISLSTNNIKKSMTPYKIGAKPVFLSNSSKMSNVERIEKEADDIVKKISTDIYSYDLSLKDIAVIGRTKAELIAVSKKLTELGIKNIVAFPEYYIDSTEVIGLKGLLSAMLNYDDTLGLANYLQVYKNDEFEYCYDLEQMIVMEKALITEDIADMDEIQKNQYMLDCIKNKQYTPAIRNLLNLFEEKELSTIQDKFEYLDKLFLYNGDDSYNSYSEGMDAIVLTTAHSAKGKEWKYVAIMLGYLLPDNLIFKNGKFEKNPLFDINKINNNNIKIIENEHNEMIRLLFVAITRAMDYLMIVY